MLATLHATNKQAGEKKSHYRRRVCSDAVGSFSLGGGGVLGEKGGGKGVTKKGGKNDTIKIGQKHIYIYIYIYIYIILFRTCYADMLISNYTETLQRIAILTKVIEGNIGNFMQSRMPLQRTAPSSDVQSRAHVI